MCCEVSSLDLEDHGAGAGTEVRREVLVAGRVGVAGTQVREGHVSPRVGAATFASDRDRKSGAGAAILAELDMNRDSGGVRHEMGSLCLRLPSIGRTVYYTIY